MGAIPMAAVGFRLQGKAAKNNTRRTGPSLSFVAVVKTAFPRVTLGKSAAESQVAAIDIAEFMKSWRGTLGVGARIAGGCLR
jgi:hypothetical protein